MYPQYSRTSKYIPRMLPKGPERSRSLGRAVMGACTGRKRGKLAEPLRLQGAQNPLSAAVRGRQRYGWGRAGSPSTQLPPCQGIPSWALPAHHMHRAAKVPQGWLQLYGGGQGRLKALPMPTEHHKTRTQGFCWQQLPEADVCMAAQGC